MVSLASRMMGAALALVLTAGGSGAQTFSSAEHKFRVVTVTKGLSHPWGMAFLPGGDMLVTEREGRLRLVRNGVLEPVAIAGVPRVVARNQGGLLDIALHPQFATNRWVYLSYSAPARGGSATRVVRARFKGRRLQDMETIFEAKPATDSGHHFGSRLVFAPDGKLFITSGERGTPNSAQDLGDHRGKIIRLHDDGRVPEDNPFVGRKGVRPEIYSYGHRNPQGMVAHPATGEIWAHEHGAQGGDEVNLIKPGVNYGWPVITHGKSYAGFPIGVGTHHPGMEQPLTYWVPSIAPSGMAFYTGNRFPRWRGNLFVGALAGRLVARLTVEGRRITGEERLLGNLGVRIRDVRDGPDGYLYLLTDESNGALLRLEPAE